MPKDHKIGKVYAEYYSAPVYQPGFLIFRLLETGFSIEVEHLGFQKN